MKLINISSIALIAAMGLSACMSPRDTAGEADRIAAEYLPAACFEEPEILTTSTGVDYVQTPEICFANLQDWPYEAKYMEIDGLRQAYVDEGPRDGTTILMLHGQPTWSYLYRFMIRDLVADGYRVIAMDHVGFGRSDKPVDLDYHSFQNHVDRLVTFVDAIDADEINLFAQDWGSVISLYAASQDLDMFNTIIIGNGGLPLVTEAETIPEDTTESNAEFHKMISMIPPKLPRIFNEDGTPRLQAPDGEGVLPSFGVWMGYVRDSDQFRVSHFVEAMTHFDIEDAEQAAYGAPFPTRITMAGPRVFPMLYNDMVGLTEERREALKAYDKPFLTIFGRNDPGLVGEADGQPFLESEVAGAQGQPHQRIQDAAHYLQDDKGPEIADMVDAFLKENT